MNRLIKAEWYRIKHSSGLLKWIIFICIILLVMPAITDIHFYEKTLSENLVILNDVTIIFGTAFTAILISICIGISYQNKMAYYEVMEGHNISSILFSKLIVYISIMTVGVAVPYGIFLLLMGWKNGMGELDKIPLRILLFFIIYIHICVAAVLITTCFRYILAAGVVFLRFSLVEELGFIPVAIKELSGMKKVPAERFSDFFTTSQYAKVLGGKVDTQIVVCIILSFVIELGLWYIASYIGMKKKKYR